MSSTDNVYCLQSGNLRYALQQGNNFIGRNRMVCRIHLCEKYIGRIYTYIVVTEDKCYLQVSAKHPLSFNGRNIDIIANQALVNIDFLVNDFITIHGLNFKLLKLEASSADLEETDPE